MHGSCNLSEILSMCHGTHRSVRLILNSDKKNTLDLNSSQTKLTHLISTWTFEQ